MSPAASDYPVIIVPGVPVPAGSHRAFLIAGRARIAPANKMQRSWQRVVSECAAEAWQDREPILGSVFLDVVFHFSRPKSHYKTSGYLKKSAPICCATRPDLDKLLRAIGDALTGIVWRDDSQVVGVYARKFYTNGQPRATIRVNLFGTANTLASTLCETPCE